VASYVQFDSFMLDAASIGSSLQVTSSNGSITITWNDYPGAILQSSPSLSPADWQSVGTAPSLTSGVATVTLPTGGGSLFFRLSQSAP
jgi:hypothetical protein